MSLVAAAVSAVQRGFHVFPVEPNGKTPGRMYPGRPKADAPWTIKWGDVATNDLRQVAQWWAAEPMFNVGIACGPSRLLVVDCDIAKRPGALKGTAYEGLHDSLGLMVDGYDVLKAACQRYGGNWDETYGTYRVCTGSMGLHLYYYWPDHVQASQSSLVKGVLDIRCNGGDKGGYVLGAGSLTEKGPYVAENTAPVRQAPAWLVEMCKDRPHIRKPDGLRQPGSANYSGLVASVESAPEGNRNHMLLWAARSMCSDGATETDAERQLVPAAARAGLDEREALATIRSAYRLQRSKEGR